MRFISILPLIASMLICCEEPYVPPTPGGKTDGDKVDEAIKAKAGEALPAWKEGVLDIHFINTSTGECCFMIFPDGTQMLVDAAGSHNPTGPVGSTTNVGIRSRWDPMKDSGFRAGEFIADYIQKCMAWTGNNKLD